MRSFALCATAAAAAVCLVSCASVSPDLTSGQVEILNTANGKYVELPQGLKIPSVLETDLSSERSKAGDPFVVRTTEAVTLDGRPLVPAGTLIHGKVVSVTPPKANLTKAKMELSVDTIELGGQRYPFHERAALDKTSEMVKKGAALGGQQAAKAVAGAAFPPLEAVFLADDVYKGVSYYQSSKEIQIRRGVRVIVKVNSPVCVPLR